MDFNHLKDILSSVVGTVSVKSKEFAEVAVDKTKAAGRIAKLTLELNAENESVKKAYAEIGKLYYEMMGAAPGEEFAAACEKITAAKAAIEANNDRIAELKVKEEAAEEPEVVAEAEAVVADAPVDEVTADDIVVEEPAAEAPKAE